MTGDLIARALVEGDDTWRRFLPFELVWAGGRAGRAVVHATTWWWHQSEAVASLAARRREDMRRKRQEGATASAKTARWDAFRKIEAMLRAPQAATATKDHDRPIGAPEATPDTALDSANAPRPPA
jgi:hypothetical protein